MSPLWRETGGCRLVGVLAGNRSVLGRASDRMRFMFGKVTLTAV